MTPLHQISTADLFAELRKREAHEHYEIKRMTPPNSFNTGHNFPARWLVIRDGEFEASDRGPVPVYVASCKSEQAAIDITDSLNRRADERRAAHAAPASRDELLDAAEKMIAALNNMPPSFYPMNCLLREAASALVAARANAKRTRG